MAEGVQETIDVDDLLVSSLENADKDGRVDTKDAEIRGLGVMPLVPDFDPVATQVFKALVPTAGLAEVLASAGLEVEETSGWKTRGHGQMRTVRGVVCHHTAGAPTGEMPSLNTLIVGRGGRNPLAGPLANIGLGRSGKCYMVAAGRAYHAGPGKWKDVTSGNSSFIGIEAEHTGDPKDPWPKIQMDAYVLAVAAILHWAGADETWCCGHKEWAPGRKPDPSFDMNVFRKAVAAAIKKM